jgi:hypothetical protein
MTTGIYKYLLDWYTKTDEIFQSHPILKLFCLMILILLSVSIYKIIKINNQGNIKKPTKQLEQQNLSQEFPETFAEFKITRTDAIYVEMINSKNIKRKIDILFDSNKIGKSKILVGFLFNIERNINTFLHIDGFGDDNITAEIIYSPKEACISILNVDLNKANGFKLTWKIRL